MNILFVLGQLPYPPRNGTTIPTYNFLTGLAAHHNVSLLLIRDGTSESHSNNLKENAALVDNLWDLPAPLRPRMARITAEFAGKSIYHIGRNYDQTTLENYFSGIDFDVVWISNSTIFDSVHPLKNVLGQNTIYVAGLNDSLTGGFRDAIKVIALKGWSTRYRVSLLSRWLRSWRLGAIEKRLLAPFDLILVQSAKDQQVLDRISNGALDRVMILSNGVDKKLFSISQPMKKKDLLFVGSLKGYSPLVEWIVAEVWPAVREQHGDATMTIVGRGASKSLLKRINGDDRITHIPFIEDTQDIYRDRMISILPVRKSSGLINKVVESMAAGIPVIGDSGSFNALPGFQDGVHGIIANDAASMTREVTRLLEDEEARSKIAASANTLVHEHFAWESRITAVDNRLREIASGLNKRHDSQQ